jgi:hypothetical protein
MTQKITHIYRHPPQSSSALTLPTSVLLTLEAEYLRVVQSRAELERILESLQAAGKIADFRIGRTLRDPVLTLEAVVYTPNLKNIKDMEDKIDMKLDIYSSVRQAVDCYVDFRVEESLELFNAQ